MKQYTQANGAFIDGIYFWTDSIGIAFGDPVAYPGTGPYTIIRTTDGGTNWNDISSSLPSVNAQYGITQRFDAVGTHFWFPTVSDGDTTVARFLFHSRDMGLTWEQMSIPNNFGNFEVAFSDSSNGLITNWYNKTARTTDGGKTWSVLYNGVGGGPLKGQKGTTNVWVQGYYDDQDRMSPIYYSSDFGLTWSKQTGDFSHMGLSGISVSSGNVAWACGFNYLVLRNSTPTTVTSISSHSNVSSLPVSFELNQNYPNPFNPATTIKYYVGKQGATKLQIYDVLGREVRTLVNTVQSAGWHIVIWDGTNESRKTMSTGTYFYRLDNNGQSEAKKMLMLK